MPLTINTILDALESDLQDKMDASRDYSTTPVIKHGYYTLRDLNPNLPAVCFLCYSEELDEAMAGNIVSYIHIRIYGFAVSDGIDSKDDIKELAHDVLYFLFSDDWSYADDTWITSNISYLEASPPTKPVGEFVFDIKIKSETTQNTLRGE